ncbi:TniQ family protein [Pararhodobacter oceanensis]|nr:TniQ family protein [Pararhodobacter oceanensis]
MTLSPKFPLDPEETLLSYTDRLSLMHTGRGMDRLLADRGILKEHFIAGRPEAVATLAKATGFTVGDVQRVAIRVFQRGFIFRGEDFSRMSLSARASRYCPVCFEDDGPKKGHDQ